MNRILPLGAVLALATGLGGACRSIPPLPPADFSVSGWRVQQGQAIWRPLKDRAELAGDLLLATNVNGNFFVQFAKPPFTLATAQVAGKGWQLEFGSRNHFWRGRGDAPKRFVWFQLPRAFNGGGVPRAWRFESPTPRAWRFENFRTGETLEGEFFP